MFPSGPAVLVWRSSPEAVVAWIANRRTLADSWIPSLKRLTDQRRARVALSTADGPLVGQTLPPDAAVRPASPGLPWTIQVTNSADDAALRDRRWLLLAGMSTLVLLIVSGAWVIERTVTRELAVADLQADFVSAVSHEFRTPLTTLCQLSEMLMRERVASEEDRRQYYAFLHGESQRLRRLVEALLNFGRLEAGRMEFHFCATDVDGFVGDIVDEFSASRQALHHRVELAGSGRRVAIRADAGLLKAALWTLLENAAKYSPDADTIWVSVQATPDAVIVSVRDRGVGIPVVERATIFEKFVRGAATRANGIGGTGVGLAMARRIVEAHGGTITVASEVGRGSTFTMTLPLSTSGIQADDDLPQRSGWPGMAGIR
jgi:signal transduction histidine kinase